MSLMSLPFPKHIIQHVGMTWIYKNIDIPYHIPYLEEQNIDLDIIDNLLFYKEKEYYLELRKSDCYGIYNLFAN